MEIVDSNKLIAEFMGKPYDYLICDACGKVNPELDDPESGSRVTKYCPRSIGNYGKTYRPDGGMLKNFKYHTSWDWLMPVVDVIELRGNRVEIKRNSCCIYIGDTADGPIAFAEGGGRIRCVYDAIVIFIKEYSNKQNGNSKK